MSKNKIYSIKNTDKETLAKWFKLMLIGRAIDDKAPNYLKQAIGWSYHAPYAGHDGIQLAIGQVFDREMTIFFPITGICLPHYQPDYQQKNLF